MTPDDDSRIAPEFAPSAPPAREQATAPAAALPRGDLQSAVEQVARELLRDRRSERRWRVFFRLAWLLLFTAIAFAIFAQRHAVVSPSGGRHTALVEVKGEIDAEAEASAENIVSALKAAFEDPGAAAIILRINSPGGSPVQAGIVNDELQRLKAKHKKKVYAVVEEVCASGAYYIAAAADEIFVDKASIVGSIGVLIDSFGFAGALDKLGIERRLITAGANKAMLDPFSPLNETHRVYAQQMIDQIHGQFIAVVKEGRGEKLKEGAETFSGLFWNGEQAVQNGLADRLGNLDFVAREVVKAEEVVDYTPKENVAERIAKRFGASIGEGAIKALRSLSPIR